MVIVVSVLVVAALVAIPWAIVDVMRRINRIPWQPSSQSPLAQQRVDQAPPFGSLPPLGPVGPLGGLSPDADINSAGTDEHDLYGA